MSSGGLETALTLGNQTITPTQKIDLTSGHLLMVQRVTSDMTTPTTPQQRALLNHQRDRRNHHDAALDAWLRNLEENHKCRDFS